VSALPVVNEAGQLLDIYARSDITSLVKGNAYSRLQWEDVTVSVWGPRGLWGVCRLVWAHVLSVAAWGAHRSLCG
jgi:hypothetical protein